MEWKFQNGRFFFLRNYQLSKIYAFKSFEFANASLNHTQEVSLNMEALLKDKFTNLDSVVKLYQHFYHKIPVSDDQVTNWTKGLLLYHEAKMEYNKQNFISATLKIDSAAVLMEKVFERQNSKIQDYFTDYPKWKQLVEKGIKQSKSKKNYFIVVNKMDRICQLYKAGEVFKSFEIELGPNWIGDKFHQGDKATPEGNYKITKLMDNGQTKYYKALLLNYPNEEDKKRFNKNRDLGLIKASTDIGGLIEIHGEGGKGVDWTDGCVALKNSDMDILYKYCKVGTEIVIVGSLKPLDELISEE
jgi:L,D-peptidoglycan transpeptidase YkuD (ErfK/YbiS/YcfS/YnhG family)